MDDEVVSSQSSKETDSARTFLTSLLNKTLRIQTSDRRLFVGQLKCTDKDYNIILHNAHEYRKTLKAVNEAAIPIPSHGNADSTTDVSSRYVGLIVVPGEHIKKIEVEEFDPALIV